MFRHDAYTCPRTIRSRLYRSMLMPKTAASSLALILFNDMKVAFFKERIADNNRAFNGCKCGLANKNLVSGIR